MRGTALVCPVFVLYAVTIGRVSMTATDAALIALGGRFEKLLLEHMDAWLEWAPRMRAAHAEVRDNKAALAVAIQHTGCDVPTCQSSSVICSLLPRRSLPRRRHRSPGCALRRSWPSGRHSRPTPPTMVLSIFRTHPARCAMRSPR